MEKTHAEIHLCRDVGSLRYAGSGLAFFGSGFFMLICDK
jgi:hypothetical protein